MIRVQPAVLLLSFVVLAQAGAVQVLGTTGNTTAPGDDPGFANIGTLNGASAIYLGGRWVLTASHVGSGTVFFGGSPFTAAGPVTPLNNQSTPGMTAHTDLILFQLSADPGLPALTISPVAPALADEVLMIGNGVNRRAVRTFYSVVQGPGAGDDIWTAVGGPGPGITELYEPGGGNAVRWGKNNIDGINLNGNSGFGTVRSFATIFDDDPPLRPNEAQAVVGDSGSAVFRKAGPDWQLLGMSHAVGNLGGLDNVPGGAGTTIIGSSFTLMADLSFYRNQILTVVPEPGSAPLLALAMSGLLRRRRD